MIYSIDISAKNIIIVDIICVLYLNNNFTLTANAVNDAPVLLQPLKDLEILEESGAAMVVHYSTYDYVFIQHLNYYRIFLI